MSEVIYDVHCQVNEIRASEIKDINIVDLSIEAEGGRITIEMPRNLLPIKEGKRLRIIISRDEGIEKDVDGLFYCTIYKVEKQRKGKEEIGLIYGSIGGLQVRMEAKGLHRKFKAGDKVFLGVKII